MNFIHITVYWKRFFVVFASIIIALNFYSFLRLCYAAWNIYRSDTKEIMVYGALLDLESFIDAIKEQVFSFLMYVMITSLLARHALPGSED